MTIFNRLTDNTIFIILEFTGIVFNYNEYNLLKIGFHFDERKTRKYIKYYIIRTIQTSSDEIFIHIMKYFETGGFSKRFVKRIGWFLTTIQYLSNSNLLDKNRYIHMDIDWERNIYMHRSMTIMKYLNKEPWQNFTKDTLENMNRISDL